MTSLADVVADDGKVSLREAITAANTNKPFHDAPAGAGADTIQFAPSLFQFGAQTIVMNGTAFDISSPITITGPSAGQLILCAVSRSRVFNIDDGTSNAVSVTLDGLTLTQGRIDDGSGGAVFNAENLTITRCTISDSRAGMNGGGIASTGRLGMGDSLVTGNTAGAFGGGIYLASALFSAPDAITKSTVSNNSAATGGGVAADASVAVAQSTFTQNNATGTPGDGGAIWSSTALSVIQSTFASNHSTGSGGGISSGDVTTLLTDTFTGNTAAGSGGAIDFRPAISDPKTATLSNDTIAANSAGTGGGIANRGAQLYLSSSIVAANSATSTSPDLSGSANAVFNLIKDPSGATLNVTVPGGANITGQDPLLAPLANYGGPTQTMALLSGSPARDHGLANGSTADQRLLPRSFGSGVDIGAYEAQPPAPPGDVNHDGKVDFADLLILAQHYGGTAVPLYENGDLTGDGKVDFSDLLTLAQTYGQWPSIPRKKLKLLPNH